MPNAKDLQNDDVRDRFLVAGPLGSGKTELFTTLPGKKFLYIFDPNALATLKGSDIEYELFLPDVADVDFAAKTLRKDGPRDKSSAKIEPRTYIEWEADFIERVDDGFFKDYDWIGFDSFTNFQESLMDRLLFLNHRTGQQPQQDDWAAQVFSITQAWRVVTAQKCGIYCTAHVDMRQDELTKKIYKQFIMTGKLRTRIPLMFNNVFISHSYRDDKGKPQWEIQTVPDKEYETVRCSLKGLDPFENVTIEDFSRPEEYGLGRLLKKAAAHEAVQQRSAGSSRGSSKKGK